MDRPDSIVGFLEADALIDERVGDVEKFVLEAEGATGSDLLDEKVAWVLEREHARRIFSR